MIKHGCVLLGIYFFVSGLASLSTIPVHLSHYDSNLHKLVVTQDWPLFAFSFIGAVTLFWLLPSLLLVRFAPSISMRFGEGETATEISDTGLYSVLALALAAYFMVTGLASLLSGLVVAIPEIFGTSTYGSLQFGLSPTVAGLVKVVSAALLYRHSLQVTRSASRRSAV